MSAVIREQVLAAVKSTLDNGLSGVSIERNRMVEVAEYPAIIVRGGEMDTEFIDSHSRAHMMQLEIECFAQAASGEALEQALNQHYGEIVQALLADHTLGGVAFDVREQSLTPMSEMDAGNKPTGAFLLVMEVEFHTTHTNPFTASP